MKAFYSHHFRADIGEHIMPMRKFESVAQQLQQADLDVELCIPTPVDEERLGRVHTEQYIRAVMTGEPRELAESQKFPWSEQLAESVRWTNGAVVDAARAALDEGIACGVCSGFHHAHADHGEGFCTFNGLVIALEHLRNAGRIERGLVIDLDLHYGNGTVALLQSRPWAYNLSIYGSWYEANAASSDVTSRRAADSANCWSRPVPNGSTGDTYNAIVATVVPDMIDHARPDVILYQAGADPYREDPYSPLLLDEEDLAERDHIVFTAARAAGVPVAWVLAGGYTRDLSKVVRIHVNTFVAASQVFGVPPGDHSAG